MDLVLALTAAGYTLEGDTWRHPDRLPVGIGPDTPWGLRIRVGFYTHYHHGADTQYILNTIALAERYAPAIANLSVFDDEES